MGIVLTIASKELRSLFQSPLAWSILGILQAMLAYLFLMHVQRFLAVQDKLASTDSAPGFSTLILAPFYADAAMLLLFAASLLTMRLISEERRNKTLALLQAAPLSSFQIIAGKAAGVFVFLTLCIALISLMPCALALGGTLDYGLLRANVLALMLLTALFTAFGLFVSCLTQQPLLAALGSSCSLVAWWMLDGTSGAAQQENAFLQYMSLLNHFQNLQSGLIDSADISFFLCISALYLVLSMYLLEKQRLQP